jgi:GTP-binding protein Era
VNTTTHCGFIAIIGRPNVGKSTLLNHILGQKVSITSHKPQTTRFQVRGIKTQDQYQAVYIDTPGLHQSGKKALNKLMNRAALDALKDVDVVVFMLEALQWREEDEWIWKKLLKLSCPIIVAVNKVDRVKDKEKLLPYLQEINQRSNFAAVLPISAEKVINIESLESNIQALLPESPFYFSTEQVTDQPQSMQMAEYIREKLMRMIQQEVPYSISVQIERIQEKAEIIHVDALVWVERPGHKAIVIGKNGERMKQVGIAARQDMQKTWGKQVFLRLWVKVKSGWTDDPAALRSLGYDSSR